MFKSILGGIAIGLGVCVITGTVIGVTASVARQIYDKQYQKHLKKQSKKNKLTKQEKIVSVQ